MSFFKKLKKSMGVEESGLKIEETKEKPEVTEAEKSELEKEKTEEKPEVNLSQGSIDQEHIPTEEKKWPKLNGELAVDMYETEKELVIQSPIAGLRAEDLDISIQKDMLIIKGSRQRPTESEEKNYLFQECYWGPFSREVILPEKVESSQIKATMKDGVLTLRMPKTRRKEKKKIIVTQEEE